MIKLDLGLEPSELKAERDKRLPAAVEAFNSHGHGSKELNDLLDEGYQVARPTLLYRQYGKCAFCENLEDHESRPVEHFRPKKEAHDDTSGSLTTVTSHYWWLAWTWSNLYFSCIKCNKQGNKGSLFPIKAGTSRATAPTKLLADPIPDAFYDFSGESALLVDPRVDEPLDHLQWIPVDRLAPRAMWRWTIAELSEKGRQTIRVFGLKGRIDRVNDLLKVLTLMAIEIDNHLTEGRLNGAREAFNQLVTLYVNDANSAFRNAAYWALDSLYPEAERQKYEFCSLPRPCVKNRGSLPAPEAKKEKKPNARSRGSKDNPGTGGQA